MDALATFDPLTTAEAAFVLETPMPKFRKIVERAPVKIDVAQGSGRRGFDVANLVFLHAYSALKEDLTPASQQALYEALSANRKEKVWLITFGKQSYDLSEHYKAVARRLKDLRSLAKKIDESGPEPTIKGTTIEAHRIAALREGGMSVEDVLSAYPSLSAELVTAAQAYAAAHPKPGRPFPKTTVKTALRRVDLSQLDGSE